MACKTHLNVTNSCATIAVFLKQIEIDSWDSAKVISILNWIEKDTACGHIIVDACHYMGSDPVGFCELPFRAYM